MSKQLSRWPVGRRLLFSLLCVALVLLLFTWPCGGPRELLWCVDSSWEATCGVASCGVTCVAVHVTICFKRLFEWLPFNPFLRNGCKVFADILHTTMNQNKVKEGLHTWKKETYNYQFEYWHLPVFFKTPIQSAGENWYLLKSRLHDALEIMVIGKTQRARVFRAGK